VVVKILSQASPFAIRHLCNFSVEPLSFNDLALQRSRPFLYTAIQLVYQGP
jgi:hypothetical protein